MNFLKNLFGGGDSRRVAGDSRGMYFYVKPHRCDDILQVRIDMNNDLSQQDEGSGYWVRKLASSGNYKCNQVELTLYFDSNRRLEHTEINGGTQVEKAAYEEWLASQKESTAE